VKGQGWSFFASVKVAAFLSWRVAHIPVQSVQNVCVHMHIEDGVTLIPQKAKFTLE